MKHITLAALFIALTSPVLAREFGYWLQQCREAIKQPSQAIRNVQKHNGNTTMLRFISSTFLCASIMGAPAALQASGLEGSIFAIERYRSIERSYITERYDIFCLQRPGFMVEVPWDAGEFYGDPSKGQIVVELIDMGWIECKHGWDLHEMGNVRLGSGGTEWVAVYNDEFLVRFTAMEATVTYSTEGQPSISALVHPIYCTDSPTKCHIDMKLPLGEWY